MTAPEPGPRRGWVPYALASGFFLLYSAYSLRRHQQFRTSAYDLGIFEQAVRAYSRLQAPVVPIKGPDVNILGDHFHPVLVMLAPLYRVWPSAQLLLVAQAALIAVSIVPIAKLAADRLGALLSVLLPVGYGLSWGLQGAVSFDFHEIAFAVPLIAFSVAALAERRWHAAAWWALPLLLVKEDMGLIVAAIGGYLFWRGERRTGGALSLAGLLSVVLTIKVVLPHFNEGKFAYDAYLGGGGAFSLVSELNLLAEPRKLVLLVTLAALTGGIALRSPIILIAVPVLLSRLLSANPQHWEVGRVHYNAILMPIIFVALLDALPRLIGDRRRAFRAWARWAVPVPLIFALLIHLTPWSLTNPESYAGREHAAAGRRVLAAIPDDSAVAAANSLAAQLTGRCRVVIFPWSHGERVDWVVADTTVKEVVIKVPNREEAVRAGLWPPTVAQQRAALAALPSQGFTKVAEEDGVILFRRDGAAAP